MAMPTRSARVTEFGDRTRTPAAIGPGSYLGSREPTKARPSLVAFASSQYRSWQKSSPSAPGPGTYGGPIITHVTSSDNRRHPSFCFESKAPRLAPQYTGSTPFGPSTVVQVPGPGTYETNMAPRQHSRRGSRENRVRQKPPFGLVNRFNPPSVPRKEQSFGYNVGSNGKLLALPAPSSIRSGDRGDCAGPGDYDPQREGWWTGMGAVKFPKATRKTVFDQEWVIRDLRPGPGDYDPYLRPRYHLKMPGSSSFISGVRRDSHRSQTSPGPGQYIDYYPRGSSPANAPDFGRGEQRGAWLRSEKYPYSDPKGNVPGPGAYGSLEDMSSFRKTIRKALTDEQIAFSSTGKRTSPGPTRQTAGMPGPGDYDLGLQSISGDLKYNRLIGCKGVFGSSGNRFRDGRRPDENTSRNPTQLWDHGKTLKRVVVLRPSSKGSSSFKSETCRFRGHSADTTPPPTQFFRKSLFDAIVERRSNSRSKPFSSTSDRRRGGPFEVKTPEMIPGPGTYNVAAAKVAVPPPRSRAQTKSTLPQGARFSTNARSESPVGPGSHEIAGSLIKRTFNITFGGLRTPGGAGRIMHRLPQVRKHEELDRTVASDHLSPLSTPDNTALLETLGIESSTTTPSSPGIRMNALHESMAEAPE